MFGIDRRPHSFKDVISQQTTVTAINNYLKNNKYPQASLFVGASGNGKSTLSRIVAMTLNCEHTSIDENGFITPCCECKNCKDILEERYSFGTTIYNGTDLSIEKIREIENNLKYDCMSSKNQILIFEEAQMIPSTAFRSLLTLIEQKRDNVYFILTSTDKSKFSGSSFANDNKSQEKIALKSRLVTFNIKPSSINDISDYLFNVMCEIDEEGKLPDSINELILFIAENAHGNVRDALNMFGTCIDGEIYTKEQALELFGIKDEEKESEIVYKLLTKDKSALTYISNSDDIGGNVVYWSKILTSNMMREMSEVPFDNQWKENIYQKIKATNNLSSLMEVFVNTHSLCGAYFNDNIFISELYKYYTKSNTANRIVERVNPSTPIIESKPVVKKIKKVAING